MIEIDSKDLITWASTAIGLLSIWFRFQYKVERLTERDTEQDEYIDEHIKEDERQHEAFWRWKEASEKESGITRERLFREISDIRATILVSTEQFKQILIYLEEIKVRIASLEKSK